MDEELENSGQGETSPVVESQDSQVSVSDSTTEGSGSESNVNPAWNEILTGIPDEFHPHLTGKLSEWDKGVQNRFQKVQQDYAPLKAYKEFADLGVKSEDINQGMQLLHLFNTQPKDLYEWLQNQHKFGQEKLGPADAETPDYDLSNEEYDLEKDPRFQAVAQKAAFAEKAIQENQRIQTETKIKAEIDNEVKQITENPAFAGLKIQDIATFAQGMPNGNRPGALIAAAEALSSYLPKPVEPRVSDSAPPVLSGNRGLPTPSTNYGKMSPEERAKTVAAFMAAANSE